MPQSLKLSFYSPQLKDLKSLNATRIFVVTKFTIHVIS